MQRFDIERIWLGAPTIVAATDPLRKHRDLVDALDWRALQGWGIPGDTRDAMRWFALRGAVLDWLRTTLTFIMTKVHHQRADADAGWPFSERIAAEASAWPGIAQHVHNLVSYVLPIADFYHHLLHLRDTGVEHSIAYIGPAGDDMFRRDWLPNFSPGEIGWADEYVGFNDHEGTAFDPTHDPNDYFVSPHPDNADLELCLRDAMCHAIEAQLECESVTAKMPCLLQRLAKTMQHRDSLRYMSIMPGRGERALYAIMLADGALAAASNRLHEALRARERPRGAGSLFPNTCSSYRYDGPHVERIVARRARGLPLLPRDQNARIPGWIDNNSDSEHSSEANDDDENRYREYVEAEIEMARQQFGFTAADARGAGGDLAATASGDFDVQDAEPEEERE